MRMMNADATAAALEVEYSGSEADDTMEGGGDGVVQVLSEGEDEESGASDFVSRLIFFVGFSSVKGRQVLTWFDLVDECFGHQSDWRVRQVFDWFRASDGKHVAVGYFLERGGER